MLIHLSASIMFNNCTSICITNRYPTPCSCYQYASLIQAENSTSCVMCPPGSYCEGDGNSEPTGLCDAGWFCTGGAFEAQPIVLGTFTI